MENEKTKIKKERAAKILRIDVIVLLIFSVIALIEFISKGSDFISIRLISIVGYFGLLIAALIGTSKYEKYAGVCAIIVGGLMVSSLNILDILLGLFIIVHGTKYLFALKSN